MMRRLSDQYVTLLVSEAEPTELERLAAKIDPRWQRPKDQSCQARTFGLGSCSRETPFAFRGATSRRLGAVKPAATSGNHPLRRAASCPPSKSLAVASLGAVRTKTGQSAVNPNCRHSQSTLSLTPEQQKVIDAILAGRNVFFTGSAGTGKSALLRELKRILPRSTTAITATTGIAACNIGT